MRITYVAVPAHTLPEGLHAQVLQFDTEIVCRMDDRYVTDRMGEALTEAVNEHAEQSWLHVASFGWDRLLTSGGGAR